MRADSELERRNNLLLQVEVHAWPTTSTVLAVERQIRHQNYEREHGFRGRFIAAVVGGLALIVPMIIMSLRPSLTKKPYHHEYGHFVICLLHGVGNGYEAVGCHVCFGDLCRRFSRLYHVQRAWYLKEGFSFDPD
jgi:hypothetical protein